ncbi:MAG: Nramp family divalent metal transporter [Gemmatimonadetes bacterium]|nr:Nramp family divalent metal transporter [Gemmatimonadota bacterium]
MSTATNPAASAPVSKAPAKLSFLKLAGPGLIVAATGIGSGDVVAGTVAGARYGVVLLWAILIGAFFKFVLTEGIARWQLATGLTALEGWAAHLPAWVKVYFGLYLVIWTVAVTAALTNATGLGMANLTGGAIAQPWGAVLHSLFGCGFVLLGGYAGFEKLMKLLVGVMGFSILICAVMTFSEPVDAVGGMLIPSIPSGSGLYVLSLIGGIGGSITILSYNYWMREEKLSGEEQLGYVRGDIGVAYLFTAMFGVAIALIANQAFFVQGIAVTDAQAVPRMAEMLGQILGPFGTWAYSVGFWAAVFASLLGVWQSVPYLYADYYGIMKKLPSEERQRVTRVTSTPYRLALLFVTLAPLPFAFTQRPIAIIITYTIVGSLFVPFLAATLLYLNNRVPWTSSVPRNRWTTNALLVVILALFLAVGAQEVINAVR